MFCDMILSESHNVLYLSSKGNYNTKKIYEILELNNKNNFQGKIPQVIDFKNTAKDNDF
jgi:hypothetical protein